MTGRIDAREDEAPKLIAQMAAPLTEESVAALCAQQEPKRSVFTAPQAMARSGQKLHLRVPDMEGTLFEEAKRFLLQHPGEIPVIFYPLDTGKRMLAPRQMWCEGNLQLVQKLRFALGNENVILK